MELFGSSGTRGVANEKLTPTFAAELGRAAGTVWDADRVAVARDTRTSGPMLACAVASGLAGAGVDVERLGIVPTPGLQAHAQSEGTPGVMITASHNPAEYNGIKLVDADGGELSIADLERVESCYFEGSHAGPGWDEIGDVTAVDGTRRRYVEGLLSAVDRERIAGADLTVAIDPGHGAGALTSPKFFRELGCRVVTVNAQPDGHFPGRQPEPVRENLEDLRQLVRASDADVGVAHDGDADRAIFVDENGEHIEGDAALAALADEALSEGAVTISAVNVSQRLVDVAESAGARLELTPIGSTRILTRVRSLRADGERVPIAGEGNGGIIFPEYRLARDGAYTGARFLSLLADRSASEVIDAYDGYHNVRERIPYGSDEERSTMLQAAKRYAEDADAELTTIDGYRLDYGDSWVLVRPSGTEPILRIYAEAKEPDRARRLLEECRRAITAEG